MKIDLEKSSLAELKALAYDLACQLRATNNSLVMVEQKIQEKSKDESKKQDKG